MTVYVIRVLKILFVIKLNRSSGRIVLLYDANNVEAGPIEKLEMETSPAILVPFYDEDSSVVFFIGRVSFPLFLLFLFLSFILLMKSIFLFDIQS